MICVVLCRGILPALITLHFVMALHKVPGLREHCPNKRGWQGEGGGIRALFSKPPTPWVGALLSGYFQANWSGGSRELQSSTHSALGKSEIALETSAPPLLVCPYPGGGGHTQLFVGAQTFPPPCGQKPLPEPPPSSPLPEVPPPNPPPSPLGACGHQLVGGGWLVSKPEESPRNRNFLSTQRSRDTKCQQSAC